MPRSGYSHIGSSEETKVDSSARSTSALPSLEIESSSSAASAPVVKDATAGQMSTKRALGGAAVLSLMVTLGIAMTAPSSPSIEGNSSGLSHVTFDDQGRTILNDYDTSKTWASFLPALGGEFGTPMWAFYVNRGQGIVSYGTENKDTSIMEFNSANKAYEYASSDGFRTFVKGTRSGSLTGGGASFEREPFGVDANAEGTKRQMMVGMNSFGVQEEDTVNDLQTNVEYFTVPGERFAALARRTTFKNTGSTPLDLQVLDGQPKVIPAGCNDWNLKNMGRTLEAWMNAYNMKDSDNTEPFFKLSLSIADTAQVTMIAQGHWAISFLESEEDVEAALADDKTDDKGSLADLSSETYPKLPFIVDPSVVFGQESGLSEPKGFSASSDVEDLVNGLQITTSKTPCAFAATKFTLAPGESKTVTSLYGRASSESLYNSDIKDVVNQKGYVDKKFLQANALIQKLTDKVATTSGLPVFDKYVRQQYMDNFLRGGYPVVLGDKPDDPKIFHTFSRIHGDTERDYNYFQIDACFFSMGPGNFRDVLQNRRVDVIQEPKVGAFDLRMFLSLIQADGYNPLSVNSAYFVLPDASVPPEIAGLTNGTKVAEESKAIASPTAKALAAKVAEDPLDQEMIAGLLSNTAGWRPGDLFIALDAEHAQLSVSDEEFIDTVTGPAELLVSADYNNNGFNADHWTYIQDLVDSYLTVFPDKEAELLFSDEGRSPFYMSPVTCEPRSKKYVLAPKLGPRQYDFVYSDEEKIAAMSASGLKDVNAYSWQRTSSSSNQVFSVDAYTKLLMLAVSKFTIMDPAGMGVEYEGGKPGWNDAMNGLCGLFGSGMGEASEALRIFKFLMLKAEAYPTHVVEVPEEMDKLMKATLAAMQQLHSTAIDAFTYWDTVRTAVETYRKETRITFTGNTVGWTAAADLIPFYAQVIAKMEAGYTAAVELNGGITPTYWIFNMDTYEVLDGMDDSDRPYVKALSFSPKPVPLFLEGPVRQMKTLETKAEKKAVYEMVKAGPMHDLDLGMYTISESLQGMSFEIGRMMAFAPGWLENESVWLHMSFKFYLEMLRAGLYEEFFEELKTGLPAFMDPQVYGRNPIECSSFIASSAHPDPSIHGQGYLARLSGSTAEFLSMWNLMMIGHQPFTVGGDGSLSLSLQPIIPGDWFDSDGKVSFMFLGLANVTYHNPTVPRKDTWDPSLRVISSTVTDADGTAVNLDGRSIPSTYAAAVRTGGVSSIDVFFGN